MRLVWLQWAENNRYTQKSKTTISQQDSQSGTYNSVMWVKEITLTLWSNTKPRPHLLILLSVVLYCSCSFHCTCAHVLLATNTAKITLSHSWVIVPEAAAHNIICNHFVEMRGWGLNDWLLHIAHFLSLCCYSTHFLYLLHLKISVSILSYIKRSHPPSLPPSLCLRCLCNCGCIMWLVVAYNTITMRHNVISGVIWSDQDLLPPALEQHYCSHDNKWDKDDSKQEGTQHGFDTFIFEITQFNNLKNQLQARNFNSLHWNDCISSPN